MSRNLSGREAGNCDGSCALALHCLLDMPGGSRAGAAMVGEQQTTYTYMGKQGLELFTQLSDSQASTRQRRVLFSFSFFMT